MFCRKNRLPGILSKAPRHRHPGTVCYGLRLFYAVRFVAGRCAILLYDYYYGSLCSGKQEENRVTYSSPQQNECLSPMPLLARQAEALRWKANDWGLHLQIALNSAEARWEEHIGMEERQSPGSGLRRGRRIATYRSRVWQRLWMGELALLRLLSSPPADGTAGLGCSAAGTCFGGGGGAVSQATAANADNRLVGKRRILASRSVRYDNC